MYGTMEKSGNGLTDGMWQAIWELETSINPYSGANVRRVISGFRTEPGPSLSLFMQDGAAETVARVRHGHVGGGPDPADAADCDRHRPFPVSEDMSGAGADGPGVGLRHVEEARSLPELPGLRRRLALRGPEAGRTGHGRDVAACGHVGFRRRRGGWSRARRRRG